MGSFYGIQDISHSQERLLTTLFKFRAASGFDLWKAINMDDKIKTSYTNTLFNLRVLHQRGIITKIRKGRRIIYAFNGGILREISKQIEEIKENGK